MELMDENFDPSSHPSVLELARLLSGEGNGGGVEEAEEDVQVKKVSRCHSVQLLLACVCISGPAVAEVSSDRDLSRRPSQQQWVWPHLLQSCSHGAHSPQVSLPPSSPGGCHDCRCPLAELCGQQDVLCAVVL